MSAELPPLPPFAALFSPRWPEDEGGFTADQMRAYAAAAVAAERDAEKIALAISAHLHSLDNLQPLAWLMARGLAGDLARVLTQRI